jgi:hypothetical protein
MGLDITFVDPASLTDGDDEFYNYGRSVSLGIQHGKLRIIDWMLYSRLGLFRNLREIADFTVEEFIKYLEDLHAWIHKNAHTYRYYTSPLYTWHEQYFADKYIMFGEIKTIESPNCMPDSIVSNLESPCVIEHHVYWTDQRSLEEINMFSDASIITSFIKELKDMHIPPNYIVKMH